MPITVLPITSRKTLEVPLSIKAAALTVERQGNNTEDDIQEAMVRAAGSITDAAEHIRQANEKIMGNQLNSEIVNLSAARRRVKEIHDTAAAKLTDIRDRVSRKIDQLEANTLPQPPKDTLGAVAAIQAWEVRTALRDMPQEQRVKVVREAIEASDAAFVAAVVNGSHLLTGMGKAEVAMVRDMWQRRHYADTLERVSRLRAAAAQLDRLTGIFTKWTGAIYAEKDDAIAAAERSAQLAAEAMATA